jgi:hypothetical protein
LVKRRLGALAVGSLVVLAACEGIVGLHEPAEDAVAQEAGGVDAGVDAPEAAPPFLCLTPFAPKPGANAEAPDAVKTYILATRGFSVGRDDAGALPGVDMDCVDSHCAAGTDAALPSSCTPAGGSFDICDEPGGVDNQVGRALLAKLNFDSKSPLAAPQVAAGRYGELIELFNYNGLPDDPAVSVGFLPSPRFEIYDAFCAFDAGIFDAAVDTSVPNWDGCDRWTTDSTYGGVSPRPQFSLDGYVADSVLYIPPATTRELPLQLGTAVATLQTPGVIAKLERLTRGGDPAGPAAAALLRVDDGTVFGRAPARDILSFFSRFSLTDQTECLPAILYADIRDGVCGSEDLPATAAAVGQSCDAISLAFRFSAIPAERGTALDDAGATGICVQGLSPDAFVDAGLLSCPPKP